MSILVLAAAPGATSADPEQQIASAEDAAPARLPLFAVKVGFGSGYLGGTDASQGAAWRLGLGYHLTQRVQLTFDGSFVTFARHRPDPAFARQLGTMTLGLTFRPFGEQPADGGLDLTNLQLHAGVGVAHAILVPYEDLSPFAVQQGAWGPAVEASIAWLPLRGQSWNAGIELQASYARFSDEPQWSISAMLVFNFALGSKPRPVKPPDRLARW